jgi:hypothetical protein
MLIAIAEDKRLLAHAPAMPPLSAGENNTYEDRSRCNKKVIHLFYILRRQFLQFLLLRRRM